MLLKDHSQTPSWRLKRAQRCLSLAVIFIFIILLGVTTHNSWPRKADLKVSSYTYGSSPEAGRPVLPFTDNSKRKSTEDPFFETPYEEEDDNEYDEAQQPIQSRGLASAEILTREELEAREGKLIGLH